MGLRDLGIEVYDRYAQEVSRPINRKSSPVNILFALSPTITTSPTMTTSVPIT